MLLLAFTLAAGVAWTRMKRIGIDPDLLLGVVVIAIVGGILGARLLHFLGSEPGSLFSDPLILFKLNKGGMAFLGGAITAGVGVFAFAKRRGVHPWKLVDALTPSLFLGLAVGRMGCFFAGCCHGAACEIEQWTSISGDLFPGGEVVSVEGFPFMALVFERGVGVGAIHGVPTFPTQLWESTAAFTLFVVLSVVWARWRRFDGQIIAMGMLLYPIVRATIELYRGDAIRGTEHFGLLSTSQVVALALGAVAVVLMVWRSKYGLAPESAIVDSTEEDIDAELEELL